MKAEDMELVYDNSDEPGPQENLDFGEPLDSRKTIAEFIKEWESRKRPYYAADFYFNRKMPETKYLDEE